MYNMHYNVISRVIVIHLKVNTGLSVLEWCAYRIELAHLHPKTLENLHSPAAFFVISIEIIEHRNGYNMGQ